MIPCISRPIAVAFLLIAPSVCSAQSVISPAIDVKPNGQEKPVNEITIHAAGQPDPLLRYRLWPKPEARRNENAAPLVSRAIILNLKGPAEVQKRFAERFEEWSQKPIDELPADEVRELLNSYGHALHELERSENLMRIDYSLQLEELSVPELVQTLLPELQEMRGLARVLSLRAKLAISEERWDDMVDDCRLGFRLAEVAGHSTDFLIGRLVGFAIASTMMDVIETAIQRPGCPNLYWALAALPSQRLFETRESLEFESTLISRIFSGVSDLPDQPIGPVAAREKFRSIVAQAKETLLDATGKGNQSPAASLLGGAYVVMMADPSRDLLAATPQWGERAYELSAAEAVLRATVLAFARTRDRWVAWSMLPPELWAEYEPEWRKAFELESEQSDPLMSLANMLTPAVHAARNAGRRTEQYRNWLITIEALRTHAAQTGELPASLDHLRPVPAWRDTIANSSFGYGRSAPDQAVLTRAPRYPDDPETTYRIRLKGSQ